MEYKITKSETITVKEVGHNDYNDLTFKDTTGKDYKISVKRKSHFENLIIVGATIKINWSEAYNKPFIYTVEKLDQQNVPQPTPDALQSKSTPLTSQTSHLVQAAEKLGAVRADNEKVRSMALAYAKDLACAGKIQVTQINAQADAFIEYIIK